MEKNQSKCKLHKMVILVRIFSALVVSKKIGRQAGEKYPTLSFSEEKGGTYMYNIANLKRLNKHSNYNMI